MKAMNRFSSNIVHVTLSNSHHLERLPIRNRSALSLARRTWLRCNSKLKRTENHKKSCISATPTHEEKKHGIQFGRLDARDSLEVVDKVIAPAFYGSDVNYSYLYPDHDDRRTAVYLRFRDLIPKFAAKPQCSASSYVLFDKGTDAYVGHVLLYKPKQNFDAHSGKLSNVLALIADDDDDHESNTLKFVRQILATKWMDKVTSLVRICLLSSAMNNEYRYIDRVINEHNDSCGYWEISGVSIDPTIQSKGYGSMIMKHVHGVVCEVNQHKQQEHNIPTILFTSTPNALKFYLRLGYKVFMEHNIDNDITSYSLVYHEDSAVKQQWLDILTEHVPYHHTVTKWNLLPKILRPNPQNQQEEVYAEMIRSIDELLISSRIQY
eukprot:26400_1